MLGYLVSWVVFALDFWTSLAVSSRLGDDKLFISSSTTSTLNKEHAMKEKEFI